MLGRKKKEYSLTFQFILGLEKTYHSTTELKTGLASLAKQLEKKKYKSEGVVMSLRRKKAFPVIMHLQKKQSKCCKKPHSLFPEMPLWIIDFILHFTHTFRKPSSLFFQMQVIKQRDLRGLVKDR